MIPLQIALCVWLLYEILGWSAFVGMGVIVLLFPLPGFVAKLIQGVQVERMKTVSFCSLLPSEPFIDQLCRLMHVCKRSLRVSFFRFAP